MVANDTETVVNGSYAVTIPAAVRDDLDLEPGDRLRWTTDEDGRLVAEIVRERHGLANGLEPIDMGDTDAVDVTEGYDWS